MGCSTTDPTRRRVLGALAGASMAGVLATAHHAPGGPASVETPPCHDAAPAGESFDRSVVPYDVPDVTLVDSKGQRVSLPRVLDEGAPVALQFVFTTCTTICPVLSNTFAASQQRLARDVPGLRLVSVSIDPEHDTPERLREYARRFDAGETWTLLTGAHDDVVRVQKAFDAYRGSKMNHEPLTFVRPAPGDPWIRLNGLMSAEQFIGECMEAAAQGEGAPGAPDDPLLEQGRLIYERGIGVDGEPIALTVRGAPVFDPSMFTCASCHRRSGFGTAEGGVFVPPIVGSVLRNPGSWSGQDLFRNAHREVQPRRFRDRVKEMRPRPAYTGGALARALREGVAPDGRALDETMPRYEVSDDEVRALWRYLDALYTGPDPGVGDTTLHLATVVAGDVPDEDAGAMLDVLHAFASKKNFFVRQERRRYGHSPGFKDYLFDSYRAWDLHVWRLDGPPGTWPAQMEEAYARQPVFALVSGIAAGPWRPIHEFCDAHALPCLFPNTALPVADDPGLYTIYFSRGVALEADALASWLDRPDERARIVLLRGDDPGAAEGADRFARAVRARGMSLVMDEPLVRADEILDTIGALGAPAEIVAWSDALDAQSISALATAAGESGHVYVSGSLLPDAPRVIEPAHRASVRIVHPFGLPEDLEPSIFRDRGWLQSRLGTITDERLQLNTYFGVTMADEALTHILTSFSRAYFLESVEHGAEESLTFGVYPRLTLGRDQRFGSKGCVIARVSDDGDRLVAVSPWIIPE